MHYKNLLFINAKLFLGEPAKFAENQYLITENGLIKEFGDMSLLVANHDAYEIIDCQNLILAPGLIDIHVHFRDPGYKFKEDIASGSQSAIFGGFTTVVCMPNTNPILDNPLVVTYLNEQIKANSKINIKFYSAATKNYEGKELVAVQTMHKNGAVGFTDDGLPIANAKIMKNLLEYSALLGVPIAQHAEDLSLTHGGCVHHGHFAQKFNLPTIDPASEYSVVARDLALMEDIPGAKYHILHVSTAHSIDYIRQAKKKGLGITCEVTPHHFLITESILDEEWAAAKMNPPLRSQKDLDAIIVGMQDGTIDIIASDHAPHDNNSKEKPISCAAFGILGLETMLPLSLELYHNGILSLERILAMLTINPARLIGEKLRGEIKIGHIADLTLIDIDYEWVIDKNKFQSKSSNTPFDGRAVKGINMMTVVAGEVIYKFE